MWHGYAVIEATVALTTKQKQDILAALKALGVQQDSKPNRITQIRPSLSGQAVLVEVYLSKAITKADAVAALSAKLGISEAMLTNNINFWVFAGGGSWEESRVACLEWLDANRDDWEVSAIA